MNTWNSFTKCVQTEPAILLIPYIAQVISYFYLCRAVELYCRLVIF